MAPDGKDQRCLLTSAGKIWPEFRYNRTGTALAGTGDNLVYSYEFTGDHAGTLHEPPAEQLRGGIDFVDISPDGRYLLTRTIHAIVTGYEYSLIHADFTGARELPKGKEYENIHFSPDSTCLIYNEGDATYALALDSFAVTPIPYTRPAWLTADGKYLLYVETAVE